MEWRSDFEEQKEEFSGYSLGHLKERMLEMIYFGGLVLTGNFHLSKGGASKMYFDMRPAVFNGEFANYAGYVGSRIFDEIDKKEGCIHYPAGVYTGGVPLALGIMLYSKRESLGINVKPDKGEQEIDGIFHTGRNYVIIDDVATSGGSILEGAEILRKKGAKVTQAVVLLDRCKGARKKLESAGIELSSIFTSKGVLDKWNNLYFYRPSDVGEIKPLPKSKIPIFMEEGQITFYRDSFRTILV